MKKPLNQIECATDMMDASTENVSIVNISWRNFLKDFAFSGFVLAAGFPQLLRAEETAATSEPDKYGTGAMLHGWMDDPLYLSPSLRTKQSPSK